MGPKVMRQLCDYSTAGVHALAWQGVIQPAKIKIGIYEVYKHPVYARVLRTVEVFQR